MIYNEYFLICLMGLSISSGMPQTEESEAVNQCSDFEDYGFVCVNYYQCNDDHKIILDGKALIDPRGDSKCLHPQVKMDAITSYCDKLIQVCCQHPKAVNESEACSFDLEPVVIDEFCDQDCIEDSLFGTSRGVPESFGQGPRLPRRPETPRNCGVRNTKGVTETLQSNAGDANFGEWPHVCAVLRMEFVGDGEPIPVYLCGASLLSESVVLTAGHCVNDTRSLEGRLAIRCGEWDTQNEDEPLSYQQIPVKQITKHHNFDADNHHHNFAILFMEDDFQLQDHISPVCLPPPCYEVEDQVNCASHGWGKDKFGNQGTFSTKLKEVVVPIVSNSKCQQLLRDNTRLGPFFELDESFTCAGGVKDVDTCKGDGGSALVCRNGRQGPWFQAGTVSWGIGCGEENTPAVYADVARVSCWIDRVVSNYYVRRESYFGFDKDDCNSRCPSKATSSSDYDIRQDN